MLKKSLGLSIVVLLTAVLFVLTGCEGPAGPAGIAGNDGSDVPFPGEITVTIPGGNNVPSLPPGITYPPKGAKILSGSAQDISTAFNGGILVANTPDSGKGDDFVAGTNGGTVYAQDAVDYVIWTGPNLALAAEQGSIVVPPGKTLFIAAQLEINTTGANTFQGITVSDKGTFSPSTTTPASVQTAVGGTSVDESASGGTIVLLNGGSITGADVPNNGKITIGGTLEIHHGASISVGGAAFLSTAKSVVNVYGEIIGAGATIAPPVTNAQPLTFEGELAIKGGGKVYGTDKVTIIDKFSGPVTVESYGSLFLGGPGLSYPTIFSGPVTVEKNADFYLNEFGGNPVRFYDEAIINGSLNVSVNSILLTDPLYPAIPRGKLKIAATGKINASDWSNINGGTDASLLAAIASGAQPSEANHYTTIEVPVASTGDPEPLVFTFGGPLTITSYENLVALAKIKSLSLPAGIQATWPGLNPPALDFDSAVPLEVSTNNVFLEGYTTVGDITVEKGADLTVGTGIITDAGTITVRGTFDPGLASFVNKLDALIIGGATDNETVTASVTIPKALFPATGGSITVNAGSTLTLGDSTNLDVDPAGPIKLEAGSTLEIVSTSATLARLGSVEIAAGASFVSASTAATFENLEILQVNGTFSASVNNGSPNLFKTLQKIKANGSEDVKGSGKAEFSNWIVDNTSHGHAFDQLLGIVDLTVASLAGVGNTKGNGLDITPDAYIPSNSDNPILRVVNAITIPGNLTVDRDLHLLSSGTIAFGASGTLTISPERKVLAGSGTGFTPKGLSVSSGKPAAVLKGGSVTVLTASVSEGVGALTVSGDTLSVEPGTDALVVLNVDGRLIAGASGTPSANILAGLGDGLITLLGTGSAVTGTGAVGTFLQGGVIQSGMLDASGDVNAQIIVDDVLQIGQVSSVTGNTATGSSITLNNRGRLVGVNNGVLSFYSGTTGTTFAGTSAAPAILVGGSGTGTIAAGIADGNAVITGDLLAYGGANVLATTGTGELRIGTSSGAGSITLGYGGRSYETLKLSGTTTNNAVISGASTFNAQDGFATLTLGANTVVGTLAGGTLTTVGAPAKLSILDGAALAAEVASFTASSQSFAGATIQGNGTGAQLIGSLDLSTGTTLNVVAGKTFAVVLDAGPTASSTLSVAGGGNIKLPGTAIVSLAAESSTFKGILVLKDSVNISGKGSGGAITEGAADITGLTYQSPDLCVPIGGAATGTAGNTAAKAAVAGSGVVSITGGTGGSTLNNTSRIIRTNT